MNSTKRLRSFTVNEKLKVINEAEIIGNRAAGRKYDIDESCIRDWRKKKDLFLNSSGDRRAFRGQSAQFPEIERILYNYIIERRELGYGVSTEMCQLKALQIAKEHSTPAFKASRGWIRNFYQRNGLSIRRRTTISQRLPSAYEEKLVSFQRHIIRLRKKNSYLLSQIGNADQTPVYFEMPLDSTVSVKGSKSVTIRTGGNEKQRCTVMLCILADGTKLPPYIVFKRKTLPKGNLPAGVIVRTQDSGWMDSRLVEDWLKCVWQRRPGALLGLKSLLVLDSYRGHTTEAVKKQLKDPRTDLAIIPGGMTSMLQPLDVCVNRPFKAALKQLYTEWVAGENHALTPTGCMKCPEIQLLCSWVKTAWYRISGDLVWKSFQKCSISNALDGSEDDAVWESSVQSESDGSDVGTSDDE